MAGACKSATSVSERLMGHLGRRQGLWVRLMKTVDIVGSWSEEGFGAILLPDTE